MIKRNECKRITHICLWVIRTKRPRDTRHFQPTHREEHVRSQIF